MSDIYQSSSPVGTPSYHQQRSRANSDRLGTPKTSEKVPKETYGLAMGQLKSWREERRTDLANKESTKQGIAVNKVIGFLNAIAMAVRLQSWIRMLKVRNVYWVILMERRAVKYSFLRAWKISHRSDKLYRFHSIGKYYDAWKDELLDGKRLKKLIYEFFKISIKRSRLTPQACMAYFNPGEWSKDVSSTDMMKIRRMMMQKLFTGWKNESRDLRTMRAKATQILARMVRRTKGPLWVKESSLVCFHMWHRYTAVKRAYRREEPDPRFTNPFLPQWTKLIKEITLARVKKKRSLETSHKLTEGRAFRVWHYLMSVDRSKPVTPLAVAIMHYSKVICNKIMSAWFGVVRERGAIIRFRNNIFARWKKWAPLNRKLWSFNDKALQWLRLKQMRRAYNVMVTLCLDVISKRTERMKVLRRNFCDRKVVICAYALMNMDEHVIFVDCWRRLCHYWRCRRNWKALTLHSRFHWHTAKAKVILTTWRQYAAVQKELRASSPLMRDLFARDVSPSTPSGGGQQHHHHSGLLAGSDSPSAPLLLRSAFANSRNVVSERRMTGTSTPGDHDSQHGEDSADDATLETSIGGGNGDNDDQSLCSLDSAGMSGMPTYLTETSSPHNGQSTPTKDIDNTSDLVAAAVSQSHSTAGGTNSAGGQVRMTRVQNKRTKQKNKAKPAVDFNPLVESYIPVGYDLMQSAMEGNLSSNLNENMFQLFCIAINQSQARLSAAAHDNKNSTTTTSTIINATKTQATATNITQTSFNAATTATNKTNNAANTNTATNTTAVVTTNGVQKVSATGSFTAASFVKQLHAPPTPMPQPHVVDKTAPVVLFNPVLQDKLQRAIDEVNIDSVLLAVSEGAVIESKHIKQVAVHIGDQFMPLFALLLSCSTGYMCERMIKRDTIGTLNAVQNPITAYLLGSTIERWNKMDLTRREISGITENNTISDSFSGVYGTIQLWRCVTLKLVDVRAKDLALTCRILHENRSVNEEVVEVLKRKKVERLNILHEKLAQIVGINMSYNNDKRIERPPLVHNEHTHKRAVSYRTKQNAQNDDQERDIYIVLREFTLMTGKLTNEGKALRGPLLERDRVLIVNGFLKQSRVDFLALRRECMSVAQRQAADEKVQKAEQKALKLLSGTGGKKKKKKKKSTKNTKKKKKNSSKSDTESDTDGESGNDTDNNTSGGEDNFTQYNNNNNTNSTNNTLNVRFNDFWMDGAFFQPFCLGNDTNNNNMEMILQEESEILSEKEFQKRVLTCFITPIFVEICNPLYVIQTLNGVQNLLVTRHTYNMKIVIKRVLESLQNDDNIGLFDFNTIKTTCGGVGQFLLDRGISDAKTRNAKSWSVLPKEWWNFKQVKARLQRELAIVEGILVTTKSHITTQNNVGDELDDEINNYEKYLKKVRKEIMKISEKRGEKQLIDNEGRVNKSTALKMMDKNIKITHTKITLMSDKLRSAEIMLASGNVKGVLNMLQPEGAVDAAPANGKTSKTTTTAPPSKSSPTKNTKNSKQVEDDDKSQASYSVYTLIEETKANIQSLKDTLPNMEIKRAKIDSEVREYDRTCASTTKLLKNLAEDRFNTMIEVQALVVRSTKNYNNSEKDKEIYSKARKKALKYFKSLKAFNEMKLVSRGRELSKDAEARRMTDILNRPPSTPNTPQTARNTVSLSPDNKAKRPLLSGFDDSGLNTPSVTRPVTTTLSSVNTSLEGLNIMTDIVITADELEAYNELRNGTANNNGADTPSTVYTHDQDDYSLDHNGHSRSVGSRDSLTPHIRSMHDSRHSGGDVIDPGEYRPLTVDEEIMLLHHNSIDNRKRREEELKRVAAAQAEESAVQELRMKVFDDYWTALPRKEGDPNPRLKKKKPITPKTTTTNTATGETIDEEEEVPAVKLSKTAKMWKSVGTAYWRGKEEALRKMVEQKVVYSSDEDEGDFDEISQQKRREKFLHRQQSMQGAINMLKPDPFTQDITIDVTREDDIIQPYVATGLLVKVTEQYNHLSDAVWKNQTAPQAPMYGRGANQVPDQSVSIRDLMVVHKPREKKEDESGDETPMTPGESTAPNSARSVRSNSLIPNSARTPRANTPKSGAPFTPRGPGRITRTSSNKSMSDKNDDPSMEGSITSVKHDPFSTTGKLEWLRYKVGMQAKAERTVDQDDDSYSVDSRRSDAKSKSVSPSKRRSSQTSGAKDSGPENFNASTSGGVQLTENSMNSSGQGQDDNMSVVTEMSQSSSVNHQSQVAEYLNMIDQPRDALSVTTSSTMSPLHKNLSVIIDRDESDDLSVVPPSEVVNEDEEVAENTVDMLNSSVRSTTPLEAIKEGISPTQQDLLNTSTLYTHPEFSDSYQSLVSSNNATPPVQRPDSPVSVESSSNAQSRRSSNAMHPVGILVTERSNRDLTSAGGGVDNDASSVNRAPKLVRFGTSNGEMPPLNRAISAPFHVDAHPTTIARSASGISQSSSHGIRSIIKENSRSSLLGTPPIAPLTTTAIAPEVVDHFPQQNSQHQQHSMQDDETSELSMDEHLDNMNNAMWPDSEQNALTAENLNANEEQRMSPLGIAINSNKQSDTNSESNSRPNTGRSKVTKSPIPMNDEEGSLDGDADPRDNDSLPSIQISVSRGATVSNIGPLGADPHVIPTTLDRVQHAADLSRNSIKVKRGAPIHNAHQEFMPSFLPPSSPANFNHIQGIAQLPEQTQVHATKGILPFADLRVDVSLQQQPVTSNMGAFLEMQSVNSKGLPVSPIPGQNLIQKKNRIIFTDSPTAASVLSPTKSNSNLLQRSFSNMSSGGSVGSEERQEQQAQLQLLNQQRQQEFIAYQIAQHKQHMMASSGDHLAVKFDGQWSLQTSPTKTPQITSQLASPSRDQFDESMLPTYTTTPLPPPQEVFEAKGTPLFKPLQVETTAENTAALRVFEGLADHDLLDVADSAASNRLASRLGLRTAPLHPNKFSTDGHQSDDNNSPPRMHHLFHRGGADEADEEVSVGSNAADLNYENLLAMVQDFKSEQQLLRDRENAMSEEAHPVVSYFPSNFRKKLMKSSSTVAAEIEVEGHDADFETRKSPTHQRNERRLSKHAKESGVTLASVNNNNNSGNSLKLGSGSGLGTPPKGTPKGGKKERLNKNLTRKSFDSDTFDDLMVQNNTKNSNRPGSTEGGQKPSKIASKATTATPQSIDILKDLAATRNKDIPTGKNTFTRSNTPQKLNPTKSVAHHAHVEEGEVNHILFPKSEALGEALKYIGEKYKFNADDVHGAQLSDAEIREVVQGINQYFQNQETLRHAPPVSPGRIRNLEMRFKAQQLREAQSLDATIDGQGGMFFKDPQEGRRNKTAEGGENSGRENKHTTLHATISIPSETTKPRAGTPPDFWVEVIKLFHPENEQFDDEHSTFSLDRRTPLTSSRRNVPTQQVPDIVLDVVKLNHPHVDASLYGSHVNSSGTPGPHTVGPRSKSRGGGANSDSFAAGNNTTNTNATTGGNGQDHMPSYVRTSVDNTLLANNQTTLLTVRPISKLESKPKSPQRRSVSPPQKQSRVPSIPLNNNNVKSKPVPINASSSITTSSGIKMTDEDFLETGMLTGTKLSKQGTVGSLEIDLTRPGSPSNAPPQSSPGTPKALNTSSILYLPTTKITTGASFMSYTEPDEFFTQYRLSENNTTNTSGVVNNKKNDKKDTQTLDKNNVLVGNLFGSPVVSRPHTPGDAGMHLGRKSISRGLSFNLGSVGEVNGNTSTSNAHQGGVPLLQRALSTKQISIQPVISELHNTDTQSEASDSLKSNIEHSQASVQIISEIAGEYYNVNNSQYKENNVQTPQKETFSGGLSAFFNQNSDNLAINSSFSSPMVLRTLPLEPPVPDSMSIYSKNSLNAAADEVLSLKTSSIVLDGTFLKNKTTKSGAQKSPPHSPNNNNSLTLRQQQAQSVLERQMSPKNKKHSPTNKTTKQRHNSQINTNTTQDKFDFSDFAIISNNNTKASFMSQSQNSRKASQKSFNPLNSRDFEGENDDNSSINSVITDTKHIQNATPFDTTHVQNLSLNEYIKRKQDTLQPAYLVIDDSNLTTQNTTPAVNFKPNLVINTERSQPVANGLESVSTPHSSLNITSEEVKKKHSHSVLQQSFTSGTSLENESLSLTSKKSNTSKQSAASTQQTTTNLRSKFIPSNPVTSVSVVQDLSISNMKKVSPTTSLYQGSVTDDLSTEHGSVANDERNEVESVTHYLDDDDEVEIERELRAMLQSAERSDQLNARNKAALLAAQPVVSNTNTTPFLAGNNGVNMHYSTHKKDKGQERRGKPHPNNTLSQSVSVKTLPPLALTTTPPTSAGAGGGGGMHSKYLTTSQSTTQLTSGNMSRGLTDVLQSQKLLKPLPKKQTSSAYNNYELNLMLNPALAMSVSHLRDNNTNSNTDMQHKMSTTAPLLSVNGGGGSGGRQNRIDSVTSVGSLNSLNALRKDMLIATPSVEFVKNKKKR